MGHFRQFAKESCFYSCAVVEGSEPLSMLHALGTPPLEKLSIQFNPGEAGGQDAEELAVAFEACNALGFPESMSERVRNCCATANPCALTALIANISSSVCPTFTQQFKQE